MDLYNKIQEEFKRKRIDKTALSKQLGISRNTVYNLNEGTAIGTIFKIIEALGMKPSDFFTEEKSYKNVSALNVIHEEKPIYGEVNYKEKYYETLEKLNEANEKLLSYTDLKKGSIKSKKP